MRHETFYALRAMPAKAATLQYKPGDDDGWRSIAGDIVLDRKSYRVWRGGHEISLSPREFRLLDLLMARCGEVLSRHDLIDLVWDDGNVSARVVDVTVGRLRRALNHADYNGGVARDPIRTVRAAGYSFDEFYGYNETCFLAPVMLTP